MSRTVPAGSLTWEPSASQDVTGYLVYFKADAEPTYDSPSVNIGMRTTLDLPLEGQTPIEGNFCYGISAYDVKGNESDIIPVQVLLDTVPPDPPGKVTFIP